MAQRGQAFLIILVAAFRATLCLRGCSDAL